MTRPPDPEAKTTRIVIIPTNSEDDQLFRKFKRILAKDEISVKDFFMPQILIKVQADNPQLHFNHVGDNLRLSKNIPPKSTDQSMNVIPCPQCHGQEQYVTCSYCAGKGTVTECK